MSETGLPSIGFQGNNEKSWRKWSKSTYWISNGRRELLELILSRVQGAEYHSNCIADFGNHGGRNDKV